jgi:ABC-2 type transport system permease protein
VRALTWLAWKDLRILRRSPLLVGLLVAYPLLVAVLIGLALSGAPDKPRVAFVNQALSTTVSVGGEEIDVRDYTDRLLASVERVPARTRAEAIAAVRSGDALGAVIIPPDAIEKLQRTLALTGAPERPAIEVVYDVADPLEGQFVEATIRARLSEANDALSERLTREGIRYLEVLLGGGALSLPLVGDVEILGLARAQELLEGSLPAVGPQRRAEVARVARFARLAVDNLDVSDEILTAISRPVVVRQTRLQGGSTAIDAFAVAVTVAFSLMVVCLLLAAGMLALEREEHAFGRLVRGLVGRTALVTEKAGLAAGCGFVLGVVLLAALTPFVGVDWGRAPLWLPALALAALAFGALGVAVGALAREVRAASLLAVLLALPVAFAALVPSGTVGPALFDAIRVVSALFPFRPALRALDVALNDATGSLPAALAHLAVLAAAYVTLARIALRRF